MLSSEIQNLFPPSVGLGAQKSNEELGQAEFFELMIAQLRNQDPTKPQDGAAFFSQIAQFGTVNGIQELEETVGSLVASLGSNQALGAATLIGRDVLVPSEHGWLEDEANVSGTIALPFPADQLTVRITSPSGAAIREINLGPQTGGEVEFAWDGFNESGVRMAPGQYNVEVEATVSGKPFALPALISAEVESVALGGLDGETILTLAGIGQFPLSSVQQIG